MDGSGDSFFVNSSSRKRKATASSSQRTRQNGASTKKVRKDDFDDEEDSIGFFDDIGGQNNKKKNRPTKEEEEEEEEVKENEDEKRLRLAMQYLEKFKKEESDEEESDTEKRMQEEIFQKSSRYHRKIAQKLREKENSSLIDVSSIRRFKGPTLSVTCTALTSDDKTVYCGSKDCSVFRFDVETGKKYRLKGGKREPVGDDYYRQAVLAVAVSSDGNFLASGGRDGAISVWDTRTTSVIRKFQGHKGPVSCLQFRQGSFDLYSGSFDRTVKLWNVEDLSYLDTLFGHQSEVTSLDCLGRERAITSSMDQSIRVWKIVEETQMLYKGSQTDSIDAVRFITDDHWISGAQDGSLALWHAKKKKQIALVPKAATISSPYFEEDEITWPGEGLGAPWISSVAACVRSNLVASGSATGYLRLWEADTSNPLSASLSPVKSIPMKGFINSINFSNSRRFLVAGVGHEHKFGRWFKDMSAKNGVMFVPLPDPFENSGDD